MKASFVLLSTTVCATLGSRVGSRVGSHFVRAQTGEEGKISNVFVIGAPQVSVGMLSKPDGSCFSGLEIRAWEEGGKLLDGEHTRDAEDIVPTLLDATPYKHPNIKTLGVSQSGKFNSWECGEQVYNFSRKMVTLHFSSVYGENVAKLPDKYQAAKTAIDLCVAISYKDDLNQIRTEVSSRGWNLVATAEEGEDVSHLVQDPVSKRCILTFEGTDSFEDAATDVNLVPADFCGLPNLVHLGFRNELRRVVNIKEWQESIRPKLGKCASVEATGHSLGGAVAMLFTACVEKYQDSADYDTMSWTQQTPEVMEEI